MGRFQGMIFDLDGTLLDSMWVWKQLDRDFLSARGIPVPEDYLRTVGAMSFDAAARYTVERFALQEPPEALMEEWHAMAEKEYRERVCLKPGAEYLLDRLDALGIPAAVATAGDPRLYRLALERTGALERFHSFTSLQESGGSKGEPQIYLKAAEKMGLRPEQCAVFEDLYAGIRAAADSGFFTVAVFDPCAPEEQEGLRRTADLYIRDFEDPALLRLVEGAGETV